MTKHPIETAPLDKEIILYDSKFKEYVKAYKVDNITICGKEVKVWKAKDKDGFNFLIDNPTHWYEM